jgi:hypothetical protein
MRWPLFIILLALTGCMHLKGVVLDDPSLRPARSAVFCVGNPNGIAVFDTHRVDANGQFDFFIGPTDDNNLYLYDGSANPDLSLRRVAPFEMNDHMTLYLRRAAPGTPGLPAAGGFVP